jgi:hypothetical protein
VNAPESRRAPDFLLENRRGYGDVVYYEFLDESIYQIDHLDLHRATTFEVESAVTTRPKYPIWMTIQNR